MAKHTSIAEYWLIEQSRLGSHSKVVWHSTGRLETAHRDFLCLQVTSLSSRPLQRSFSRVGISIASINYDRPPTHYCSSPLSPIKVGSIKAFQHPLLTSSPSPSFSLRTGPQGLHNPPTCQPSAFHKPSPPTYLPSLIACLYSQPYFIPSIFCRSRVFATTSPTQLQPWPCVRCASRRRGMFSLVI